MLVRKGRTNGLQKVQKAANPTCRSPSVVPLSLMLSLLQSRTARYVQNPVVFNSPVLCMASLLAACCSSHFSYVARVL